MRVFLAVELPDEIKKDLVGIQRDLESRIPGVRWEKPEKLHLTLVFLGEVAVERIKDLEEAVQEGISPAPHVVQGKGFKVGLSGVRVFPNEKRPRVVLMEVGEGREEIERLQKSLAEALSEAGFEFAKLSKPHVTLGRFQRGVDATRRVNWDSTLRPSTRSGRPRVESRGRVGDFRVKEVVVVESELYSAGAIHTPIARIPL